jgi:hypothetical protein
MEAMQTGASSEVELYRIGKDDIQHVVLKSIQIPVPFVRRHDTIEPIVESGRLRSCRLGLPGPWRDA